MGESQCLKADRRGVWLLLPWPAPGLSQPPFGFMAVGVMCGVLIIPCSLDLSCEEVYPLLP